MDLNVLQFVNVFTFNDDQQSVLFIKFLYYYYWLYGHMLIY